MPRPSLLLPDSSALPTRHAVPAGWERGASIKCISGRLKGSVRFFSGNSGSIVARGLDCQSNMLYLKHFCLIIGSPSPPRGNRRATVPLLLPQPLRFLQRVPSLGYWNVAGCPWKGVSKRPGTTQSQGQASREGRKEWCIFNLSPTVFSPCRFTAEGVSGGALRGKAVEQYAFQQLLAVSMDAGIPGPAYYAWQEKGKGGGKYEMDFMLADGGETIPVEVKGSASFRSESMDRFRTRFQPARMLRLSPRGPGIAPPLWSLPLAGAPSAFDFVKLEGIPDPRVNSVQSAPAQDAPAQAGPRNDAALLRPSPALRAPRPATDPAGAGLACSSAWDWTRTGPPGFRLLCGCMEGRRQGR